MPEAQADAGADGKARVLIVEDDYLAASDAEFSLRQAGYEVVGIARSADDALRLASAERPRVIVMDIRLSGQRDGIEAAIELFRATGIRCVFATAHDDAWMRLRARPANPLGWLPKPYTSRDLIETVRSAVETLRQR